MQKSNFLRVRYRDHRKRPKDGIQRRKEAHFSHFISRLNQAVATYIKCDDVRQTLDTRVIRPREPVDRPEQLQERRTGADTPPLFHGYHGFDAFFLYG